MTTFITGREPHGHVTVIINSRLNRRGVNTPINIRDDQLVLVEREVTIRHFSLAAGLYEISALNDAAILISRIVAVHSNQSHVVSLDLSINEGVDRTLSEHHFITPLPGMNIEFKGMQVSFPPSSAGLQFTALEHSMVLRYAGAMEEVASLVIANEHSTLTYSLPLSSRSETHHHSVYCHLIAPHEASMGQPQVRIAPIRTVAFAMQQLYQSNRLHSSADTARNALDYLTGGVKDPTGALMCAISLFKAGKLNEHREWLDTFNQNYPWLPDGKIIQACLHVYEQLDAALDLAYTASQQTILYRETFYMLLNFVRQHSSMDDPQGRAALQRLTSIAPYVDWRSTFLCHSAPPVGRSRDV